MIPWTRLASTYLLRRPWLSVRADRVQLPGGAVLEEYHVLEIPDWACVVARDEAGRLVMVRQYRHGIGATSLEFPAGIVEDGEAPLEAARRELREETGYAGGTWVPLGAIAADPTRQTNRVHYFLAEGVRPSAAPDPDLAESIRVELWADDALLERARAGEMQHGLHVAGLFLAHQRGAVG